MTGATTPTKRPCTALRQDGNPCRAWAVRPRPGQPQPGNPRCAAHGGRIRCAAQTGQSTRALLSTSANARPTNPPTAVLEPIVVEARGQTGFYDDVITDAEFNALRAIEDEYSLAGEIRIVRVLLRRLLVHAAATPDMAHADLDRRALTIFRGAEVMAQLQRVEMFLRHGEDDIHLTLHAALDELSEEWDIEL